MSGKEDFPCTVPNCQNKAEYFCIVEDDIAVCIYHLPPAGQGTEYFREINNNE